MKNIIHFLAYKANELDEISVIRNFQITETTQCINSDFDKFAKEALSKGKTND